jgi:4-carboxymuconolactone decarboxylase
MKPIELGKQIRHTLFTAESEAAWQSGPAQRLVPELNRLTDEVVFGNIWSREGLPIRTRSLATIAALIALGKDQQLKGHMAGALRLGISGNELAELVLQMAFYAGWPAAYRASELLDMALSEAGAPRNA